MATNPIQPRFGCYIGNIDRSVTLEMLKQVFCQCGTIIDCSLNGREEDPYRYGFIDFATEDDRARAMKYNGYTLVGRKLKVGVSKGNVNKPEGYNNNSSNHANNRSGMNLANPAVPNPITVNSSSSALPAGGNNLAPAQQMEAQLLLQLIQQGSLDTGSLTEFQKALLLAALPNTSTDVGNTVGATATGVANVGAVNHGGSAMPMQPMNMMQPPFFGAPMWGPMVGMPPQGMMPMNPMMTAGRGVSTGFHRGPANPPPSEETLKLREIQRKQFIKVVRDETEAYEKKLQERSAKEGRMSGGSDEDEGSSDEESDSGKVLKRKKIEKSEGGISDDGAEEVSVSGKG